MNMYRYSNKKYNDLLFKMGIIRIGTLHDFRRSEHKRGIADPTEGTKSISHQHDLFIESTENLTNEQKDALQGYEELNAIKLENCKNITLSNIHATKKLTSDDYFILCTASKNNVINEFEGYDSCYKITSPIDFYKELTIALNRIRPVRFLGYSEVVYKDRNEKWEKNGNKLHPAQIKETEFSGQAEIRAIWEPLDRSKPIEPIVLGSYKLGRHIKHLPL